MLSSLGISLHTHLNAYKDVQDREMIFSLGEHEQNCFIDRTVQTFKYSHGKQYNHRFAKELLHCGAGMENLHRLDMKRSPQVKC